MIKRFTSLLAVIGLLLLSTHPAHAAWTGLENDDVATFSSLGSLFEILLANVLRLVGFGTFIMIIVGGFKYLTAGGDAKATEAAKQTITYGIIGLVLAVASWFIILAISGFTGNTSIKEFNLGF
jgi:hypothetical protein